MKRDPRLTRSGERRSPRRLHARRFDPRLRLLRGMGIRPGLRRVILKRRGPNPYIRAGAVADAFVEHVFRAHGELLAAELFRCDGVRVGWDVEPL